MQTNQIKHFIQLHRGFLVGIGLLFTGVIILQFLVPNFSLDTILEHARNLVSQFGIGIFYFVGVVEGLLLINWYFPGSTVILLGALFASEGMFSLPVVVLVAAAGLLTGLVVDYIFGRYGWYKLLTKYGFKDQVEQAMQQLKRRGGILLVLWNAHPQLGNFAATAAGVLHYPFGLFVFFSALGLVVWGSFWGLLVFFFGRVILDFLTSYVFPIFIGALMYWVVSSYLKWKKSQNKPIANI